MTDPTPKSIHVKYIHNAEFFLAELDAFDGSNEYVLKPNTQAPEYVQSVKLGNLIAEKNETLAAQAARIAELEARFEDVIVNLEDLRKRPTDMMILGTALSIARNYKKVKS